MSKRIVHIVDLLGGDVAWGQIAKYGPFHAFRPAWWADDQWVPECNRHANYTDLRLHSLDNHPGPSVCSQAGCAMAYSAWRRVNVR